MLLFFILGCKCIENLFLYTIKERNRAYILLFIHKDIYGDYDISLKIKDGKYKINKKPLYLNNGNKMYFYEKVAKMFFKPVFNPDDYVMRISDYISTKIPIISTSLLFIPLRFHLVEIERLIIGQDFASSRYYTFSDKRLLINYYIAKCLRSLNHLDHICINFPVPKTIYEFKNSICYLRDIYLRAEYLREAYIKFINDVRNYDVND